MSTKKSISTSFVAIFILIITQIIAQSTASMFVIIKIPTGICNIIAGIIYAGLTYLILKMFISKWIFLCDEIALPEIWKSDVRKWKSSMRVYSRNVLSRPYTSRMDLSCAASILVMLI